MEKATHVPSLTRTDRVYAVTNVGGVLFCDCPAYVFGKRNWKSVGGAQKDCKHLKIYRAAESALAQCAKKHAGQGGYLCGRCLVELLAGLTKEVRQRYVPKQERRSRRVNRLIKGAVDEKEPTGV